MEDRCPLCLKLKQYDDDISKHLKFQNSGRLVCKNCATEIKDGLRPTWQVVAGRVYPKSTKYN